MLQVAVETDKHSICSDPALPRGTCVACVSCIYTAIPIAIRGGEVNIGQDGITWHAAVWIPSARGGMSTRDLSKCALLILVLQLYNYILKN